MAQDIHNDIIKDNRVTSYLTQYEIKLLDRLRETTGETQGGAVRRIVRLYLKGELVQKTTTEKL